MDNKTNAINYVKFPKYGLRVIKLNEYIDHINVQLIEDQITKILWKFNIEDIKNWELLFQVLHSNDKIGMHIYNFISTKIQDEIRKYCLLVQDNYINKDNRIDYSAKLFNDALKRQFISDLNNLTYRIHEFYREDIFYEAENDEDIRKIANKLKNINISEANSLKLIKLLLVNFLPDKIWANIPYKSIIFFRDTEYLSSAGWGIFIGKLNEFTRHGGKVVFADMQSEVYEVFDLLEFYNIFEYYDTIYDALKSFYPNSTLSNEIISRVDSL
ncbi:MAG: STAS domain-containing protein [Candidatus Lokiarchaeota archaeon]|nr:STAS domain-containing protein [Candidatus Lokiarchaeota archaeon]